MINYMYARGYKISYYKINMSDTRSRARNGNDQSTRSTTHARAQASLDIVINFPAASGGPPATSKETGI